MIFKGRRQSGNVIDQRSIGGKTLGGGALILGAIVYYFMGGNPLVYLAQNAGSVGTRASAPADTAQDNERKEFASVVLADTEDVWSTEFQANSMTYKDPQMVLYRGSVESACGTGESAMGPFYCPGDQRIYLDLGFFDELSGKLGANGDFAAAYVIAHEVGHHVQNLLGLDKSSRTNEASVRVELQADCLAGVWAKQTEKSKGVIEGGDIAEATAAASAVGDDRLQQQSRGYVVPDSFTHGSSAQRKAAFNEGYAGGSLKACVQ